MFLSNCNKVVGKSFIQPHCLFSNLISFGLLLVGRNVSTCELLSALQNCKRLSFLIYLTEIYILRFIATFWTFVVPCIVLRDQIGIS